MKKFIELFKKELLWCVENRCYVKDQPMFSVIRAENRKLFAPYYGDYQDIFTGFRKYTCHSHMGTGLALFQLQRCENVGNMEDVLIIGEQVWKSITSFTAQEQQRIFDHLKDNGVLVACIGNMSMVPEIAKMEHLFRVQFTYNQLEETKRPRDFEEFKESFEEKDKKASINWQSYSEYLNCMKSAGFTKADIVWHLWIRSIFVALK